MSSYKQIGKGSFTTAYIDSSNRVYLKTTDPIKECMANYFPNSTYFPKVKHSLVNGFDYEMKYYDRVVSPKKDLNEKSYLIYQELRGIFKSGMYEASYNTWYKAFKRIKSSKGVKLALLGALDQIVNYSENIEFEISPRNIKRTDKGNIILLDCFFLTDYIRRR
jgi:hypothetical protein